jgi:hypothetical protein
MFKLKSSANSDKSVEKSHGWDALIAEAKGRIQDLEYSVLVFERKKAACEPFPHVPQSDRGLISAATR